ncbi:MAG TPA: ABC transporter substrate-binding protein, partial [Pseudomonadales bacterium]|nr:ABC transporter substrate-binding protein [Pseudomonadales bacterium]
MIDKAVRLLLLIALSVLVSGCNQSSKTGSKVHDNSAEVAAYYRDHPKRFVYATPADLPKDLKWQDGAGLPTFGDPRAKRGGELTLRLNTMQQTLRVVGPDANGSLRGPLWSANMVSLIERHPWADGYIPGVAREWAIDPKDSRIVYLKLDPDARWSDGRPFTVDDLFFSLYFLLSHYIKDPAINRVYDESVARITRYDAETVSITNAKESPDPLGVASGFILCEREFYRQFGPDYTNRYHWRFAPVTGPYTVDPARVNRGERITFDRLPHWWADNKRFYKYRFNPDQLNFVVIRDDAKAFDSFLNGDVDWFPLDRNELWYDHADEDAIKKGYIDRAQVYDQLPAARSGIYM